MAYDNSAWIYSKFACLAKTTAYSYTFCNISHSSLCYYILTMGRAFACLIRDHVIFYIHILPPNVSSL